MSEAYTGQSGQAKLGMTEDEALVSDLHRAWLQSGFRNEAFPSEGYETFIGLAHRGSILAANILHISGIEWDNTVKGEPYDYQPAVFHPAQPHPVIRYDEWSNEESNES